MRRISLIAAVTLVVSALIFAHSQSPTRTTQTPQTRATAQPLTIDRVVSTQQRINRYFHGDVMPRLQKCWSTVRGQGTIGFEYTYIEAKGRWLFSRLQKQESTLANGQDSLALKCMLNAVGGVHPFQPMFQKAVETPSSLTGSGPFRCPQMLVNSRAKCSRSELAMVQEKPTIATEVAHIPNATPAPWSTLAKKFALVAQSAYSIRTIPKVPARPRATVPPAVPLESSQSPATFRSCAGSHERSPSRFRQRLTGSRFMN